MTTLIVENITIKAGQTSLVKDVSLNLKAGELVALLGPNGAGKTSLLRSALGFIKPDTGKVTLKGEDIQSLSPIARARHVSYLPQIRPLTWPNRVSDIVALGRYSHGANLARLNVRDAAAIDTAMADCDITHLALRKADTLSGGECARMHCARAFAAQAPLLVADEPVAALDPRHQFRVMDLIKGFVEQGGGALVVLHDISLAAKYADRLIWMKEGMLHAEGTPQETLTAKRLKDIYQIDATVDGLNVQIDGAL